MSKQEANHIVLVDDELRIHEMIGEVLLENGLAEPFQSFRDPVEFLEFLKKGEEAPDLILLDVHFENSGLTGVDILPFIREEQPFLPVVMLTGMEGESIEEAQDFECVYYIPKPVSPEHLVKMVQFYLGKGRKSGKRMEDLSREVEEYKELLEILESERGDGPVDIEAEAQAEESPGKSKDAKAFNRLADILHTVLKNCEVMPSFEEDMKKLYASDFKLLKRAVDTVIRFDLADLTSPGLNIKKVKGTDNAYSLRLSKKARIFFYPSPSSGKRRLLRVDVEHATKEMDKWLKSNFDTYADH